MKLVLEDENILTVRKELLKDRASILNELEQETNFMLKVRKRFIEDKIDHDDFISLKRGHREKQEALNEKLSETDERIRNNEFNSTLQQDYIKSDIFFSYKHQDVIGKRHLISFLQPTSINPSNMDFDPLDIDTALRPILNIKQQRKLTNDK